MNWNRIKDDVHARIAARKERPDRIGKRLRGERDKTPPRRDRRGVCGLTVDRLIETLQRGCGRRGPQGRIGEIGARVLQIFLPVWTIIAVKFVEELGIVG